MILPTTKEIRSAHDHFRKENLCSDLIQLDEMGPYLKNESHLPGNSYKIRGVKEFFSNSGMAFDSIKVLSAGNLALATAIEAAKRGILCQAVVPIGVSDAKKSQLQKYGAKIVEVPFQELWTLVNTSPEVLGREYLHPLNRSLLCGYSTLIPELREQIKTCNALVIPYGLGGLTLALAHGCKMFEFTPRIYAVEIDGHSPFISSLKRGKPESTPKLQSFIEAMGAPGVLPEVFEQLMNFQIETITVTEAETKEAIRNLHQSRAIRVEGAAGAAYAAAKKLTDLGEKRVVAVLTGGNISNSVFDGIISEQL